MRAVPAGGSPGRSKASLGKKAPPKKPKKAASNATIKRTKVEVKRVKKPNEKFKKRKPEAVKPGRSPKRGEEGGPPTLCEAYSRLTTMVAETVINEKAGAKLPETSPGKQKPEPKKTSKGEVTKRKANVKKKTSLNNSKVVKIRKPSKPRKIEKVTLDKCENLVTVLKDEEVVLTFGKGIGTRRKSICNSEDSDDRKGKLKPHTNTNSHAGGKRVQVTKPAKKSPSNTKPIKLKAVKKVVKRVTNSAVHEKKPKKNSQTKSEDKKKIVKPKGKLSPKVVLKKVKLLTPTKVKNGKAKKSAVSETDGSNSDEMTLNVLMKKQRKRVKKESAPRLYNFTSKAKQAIKREEPAAAGDHSKSPDKKSAKVSGKKEKADASSKAKDSGTDSEDDIELQRLLAKKYPKSKPAPKKATKSSACNDSDQRARRLRLYGFWSGPKRHRVASLNASAKVHCLYENESKVVPEAEKSLGKPDEKDKKLPKKEQINKERKAEKELEFEQMESVVINKRTLRGAPGTRGGVGKHWDMGDSTSTTSSVSSDESHSDTERKLPLQPSYRQKLQKREEGQRQLVKPPPKRRRNAELGTTMDLKDMVVRKRMASLNASAILAASYSFEKRTARKGSSATSTEDGASSPDDARSEENATDEANSIKTELGADDSKVTGESSAEKLKKSFWKTKVENLKKVNEKRNSPSPILADFGIEKKIADKVMEKEWRDEIQDVPRVTGKKAYRRKVSPDDKPKRRRSDDVKQINIEKLGPADEYEYKSDSDTGQRKLIELRNAGGSNKKVAVIVNQDTDVTIRGVYVNSTRSTHHEGYCSIDGMQYRISSTSHTQTEATAVLNSSTASDQVSLWFVFTWLQIIIMLLVSSSIRRSWVHHSAQL